MSGCGAVEWPSQGPRAIFDQVAPSGSAHAADKGKNRAIQPNHSTHTRSSFDRERYQLEQSQADKMAEGSRHKGKNREADPCSAEPIEGRSLNRISTMRPSSSQPTSIAIAQPDLGEPFYVEYARGTTAGQPQNELESTVSSDGFHNPHRPAHEQTFSRCRSTSAFQNSVDISRVVLNDRSATERWENDDRMLSESEGTEMQTISRVLDCDETLRDSPALLTRGGTGKRSFEHVSASPQASPERPSRGLPAPLAPEASHAQSSVDCDRLPSQAGCSYSSHSPAIAFAPSHSTQGSNSLLSPSGTSGHCLSNKRPRSDFIVSPASGRQLFPPIISQGQRSARTSFEQQDSVESMSLTSDVQESEGPGIRRSDRSEEGVADAHLEAQAAVQSVTRPSDRTGFRLRFPPALGEESVTDHASLLANDFATSAETAHQGSVRLESAPSPGSSNHRFASLPRVSLLSNTSTEAVESSPLPRAAPRVWPSDDSSGTLGAQSPAHSIPDTLTSPGPTVFNSLPFGTTPRLERDLTRQLADLRSRVNNTAMELARWRARSQRLRQRISSSVAEEHSSDSASQFRVVEGEAVRTASFSENPLGHDNIDTELAEDSHAQRRYDSLGSAGRLRGPTRRANEVWRGLEPEPITTSETQRPFALVRRSELLRGSDTRWRGDVSGPARTWRSIRPVDSASDSSPVDDTRIPRSAVDLTPEAPQLPDIRARSPLSLSFDEDREAESGRRTGRLAEQEASDRNDRPQSATPRSVRAGLRPLALSASLLRSDGTRRGAGPNATRITLFDDDSDDRSEDEASTDPFSRRLRPLNTAGMLSAGQSGRRWMPEPPVPLHSQDRGLASLALEQEESDGETAPPVTSLSERQSRPLDGHRNEDGVPISWDDVFRPADRTSPVANGPGLREDSGLLEHIARRRARRLGHNAFGTSTAVSGPGEGPIHRSVTGLPYRTSPGDRAPYSFTPTTALEPTRDLSRTARTFSQRWQFEQERTEQTLSVADGLRRRPTAQSQADSDRQSELYRFTRSPSLFDSIHEDRRDAASGIPSAAAGAPESSSSPPSRLRAILNDSMRRTERLNSNTAQGRQRGEANSSLGSASADNPTRRVSESPFEYLSRMLRQDSSSGGGGRSSTWRPGESSRDSGLIEEWIDDLRQGPWTSTTRIESFLRLMRHDGHGLASDPANYLTDEEWETSNSYESLTMLSSRLGDVLPKNVPAHIVASLPTCLYSQWRGGSCETPPSPPIVGKGKQKISEDAIALAAAENASKDTNCAICLDEYKSLDMVMSIPGCNHAFHETCLTKWFESARTCPFCRADVAKACKQQVNPISGYTLPELNL